MAGFVTAIWFELIFFAPRALSEPIALAPLMGAVWLLVARRAPPGPWQFAFAGLLMGLSFVARIHYAPALPVLAGFTAKRDWPGAGQRSEARRGGKRVCKEGWQSVGGVT